MHPCFINISCRRLVVVHEPKVNTRVFGSSSFDSVASTSVTSKKIVASRVIRKTNSYKSHIICIVKCTCVKTSLYSLFTLANKKMLNDALSPLHLIFVLKRKMFLLHNMLQDGNGYFFFWGGGGGGLHTV